MATRPCPYCAEEIQAEAVLCRFCRTRLLAGDPTRWHRDHADRRLAGVAGAVGHGLALPVSVIRVGFVVLTFFHLLGPMAYAALWAVIPPRVGAASVLDRGFDASRTFLEHLFGSPPPSVPGEPHA